MAGLDDVLAEYQRQIKGAVELTAKERAQITKAGADIFRDKLEEANRELHRSRTGKNHMSDHILLLYRKRQFLKNCLTLRPDIHLCFCQ